MKKIKRTAISLAVGLCLSGVVLAQSPEGNIVGQTKAGATVTVTSPATGVSREMKAEQNGSFTFSRLPPGNYRVVAEGVTRDVTVTAGTDARVTLDSAVQGERVTVTGSRIARDTFNTVSPVQIITREESTLAGFNSTTDVLQSTGVTAGGQQINNAFGGFVTDGGPGANTLGLRGLGATRTLVLLNGRRIAPAGTRGAVGSADLNVLPNAILDHIEILKDGASSIYGSDAVAGVVNLITRRNIKGWILEGQGTATDNGGGGDQRYSVTYGNTFDRGYFTGSLEFYRRNELTLADRDWTQCNTDYRRRVTGTTVGDWGSLDFIDPLTGKPKCYPITSTGSNGVTINTIATGTMAGVGAAGSVGTTFNRWRPNSGITTGLVGFEGVGGGANNLNVRDTFDRRTLDRSLISPVENRTGFFQGGYDLRALGQAEAYFELLTHKRESHQNSGNRQFVLDYAQGSPLIPTQLAAAPIVQSAPLPITNGRPLHIRAFIGFGNYRSEQEVDYNKGLVGIKGNLPWSDWRYDLGLTYAKSDARYTSDQSATDRLAQSLDVVAAPGGGFVCRNPANGCVAAPVLSSAVVAGVLPRNWVDFFYGPDTGNTTYKETIVNLGTNGTLFPLRHGDVRAALGVEYRRAEIDDTPSINSQNSNLYGFTSSAITRGKDSVWEAYGELEVPVLRGMPGAEELTVNVSGRYTDYQSYGGDTTYKAGAIYRPVKWLSLRGSQGTSYRAPALFEQFLGSTSGFLSPTGDPCNNYGADPTTIRARNCASEGLPPDFQQTGTIRQNAVGGAASGLKAETSKNLTLGIQLQPTLPAGAGDFSFAVDYYKIEVDNGVDRVGAGSILSLCYNDPTAFSSRGGYCRLITRGPAGSARNLAVDDSYINVSSDNVRGYDFTVRYVRDIGPGQLRANLLLSKYLEQSNKLFPTDPLTDYNGLLRTPKRTGTLDVQYKVKAWRFRYGLDWVDATSSYTFYEEDPATSRFKMDTPSYLLHNASVEYKGDKWSATAGVRNIADKDPPQISSGFINRVGNAPLYSGYDYVGRRYFVNVTKEF